MQLRYYLDTSIWRDYYEDRSDRPCPLGEWALQLLCWIVRNKHLVIYSDFVLHELSIDYSALEIGKVFEIVTKHDLLVKVNISGIQRKEATSLGIARRVSFGDALHTVLARDNSAIMVTRDRHFLELMDIVEVRKPEELL